MGRLLDRLRSEQAVERKAAEKQQVREIVGTSERPDHLSGFSAACRDAQAEAVKAQSRGIERILRAKPHLIATPSAEAQFRAGYPEVPDDTMNEIIAKVKG